MAGAACVEIVGRAKRSQSKPLKRAQKPSPRRGNADLTGNVARVGDETNPLRVDPTQRRAADGFERSGGREGATRGTAWGRRGVRMGSKRGRFGVGFLRREMAQALA